MAIHLFFSFIFLSTSCLFLWQVRVAPSDMYVAMLNGEKISTCLNCSCFIVQTNFWKKMNISLFFLSGERFHFLNASRQPVGLSFFPTEVRISYKLKVTRSLYSQLRRRFKLNTKWNSHVASVISSHIYFISSRQHKRKKVYIAYNKTTSMFFNRVIVTQMANENWNLPIV